MAAITSVTPSRAVAGGRISLAGTALLSGQHVPDVRIGDEPARLVFASATQLDVLVPSSAAGLAPVRLDGQDGGVSVSVGDVLARGLHQVDNPACTPDGNLFVTYSGSRGQRVPVSIFKVTPDGTRESFSSAVANPTSLAASPDGDLYVSSRFEGAVYRLAPDGSAEVYVSDLGLACGLAFAPDGTLYVGDRSGTVFEVTRGGQARTFATLPASVAAFHLAFGTDGLYVTAPTLSARDAVYRVAFDGAVSVVHAGFGRPQGLAFSPDGELHVVEALAGVSGVYRVPVSGPVELVVSGSRLVGVAFDGRARLVVCSADTAYGFTPR